MASDAVRTLGAVRFVGRAAVGRSRSVDIVHSAGRAAPPARPSNERCAQIRRVVADDGYCQIMVYHYNSIWMHLYAGYIYKKMFSWRKQIPSQDIFKITTRRRGMPHRQLLHAGRVRRYRALAAVSRCEFQGAAMSLSELMWLPRRFEALNG